MFRAMGPVLVESREYVPTKESLVCTPPAPLESMSPAVMLPLPSAVKLPACITGLPFWNPEKEKTYLPFSREVGPLIARLSGALAVPAGVSESLTCTVKFDVPWEVGVPEINPEVLMVRPAGKAPDVTDQEYGGTPPEAAKAAL